MLERFKIERAILKQRSFLLEAAWVVAGVALATSMRWIIDRGESGVQFATFFPVIVLASFLLRWQMAVLCAVLSFVVASVLFMDAFPPEPSRPRLTLALIYVVTVGLLVFFGQVARARAVELQRRTEELATFNAELQHRVGNVFQMTKAIASRATKASDPVAFYRELVARLEAMAAANRHLGITRHRRGNLADILETALAPFASDQIICRGPDCEIGGDLGMNLTMILHELATNATKYGALSTDEGEVTILWSQVGGKLELSWQEAGGPRVDQPTRKGIGTSLLTPHGPLQAIDLQFHSRGLACHMVFNL